MAAARDRMRATVQWDNCQFMGRRWPIGCVALEITQRCNLDCTACYLSEHSEAVKDVPLSEILRRVDMIHAHYGPGTGVQITGGDPTLRKRSELIEIVRAVAQKGMQPALYTNGIRAKRGLLAELAEAGLVDVAFHVDMTQKRRGYDSELALNDLRSEYIERARGLPIAVMFNTTGCASPLTAFGLGLGNTLALALQHDLAFDLGEAGKDCENQSAGCRLGVHRLAAKV
jgi:hypothetical protein